MPRKVWAIVAQINGEERYVRKVNYITLQHEPVSVTRKNIHGKSYRIPGRPRRYQTLPKAEKALALAKTFDGVNEARLVNLVLKSNGRPYGEFTIDE